MASCQLEITAQELHEIEQHEAVVVQEWERQDGSRFARLVAWGTEAEMVDVAHTKGLLVVPVELTYIGLTKILVSELLE